jgi:hypothetical protein
MTTPAPAVANTAPNKLKQPDRNATALDALRAAEENERRGADIVRENQTRVAAAERAHAEALADMVEGKVAAEVAAEKGAALADAGRELESARKAHEILIGRLAAARREQERVGKAEVIGSMQRLFDKRLALARAYEAVERDRGKVWGALHKLTGEIVAAWPGGGTVPVGCLLDRTSLRLAWESEVYRQHANPDMLGGAGLMRPNGPPTIPGARAGDLTKIWQPEKLQSFVDAVAQANTFLLSTLAGSTPAVATDIPAANGASAPAVDVVPRSEVEGTRGELLRRMAQLADDPSADQQEYDAVVAAFAKLDTPEQQNA